MDIYETLSKMRIERKRIEDIEMRVTYYARVSTTKEEQDSSIEAQVVHFEQMIGNNPNWTYVEGYVDRVRGENADNRAMFQQMVQDGYDGKFDLILTKEVSRFARNTIDSLTYTRELLRHGVGVFFLTDNICTIEQDSELRLTIMSSIAQDEVRKLSERVKFGAKKAIERGHVFGNSRIFGYDLVGTKLIINEHEAEMVRLIFTTYATGQYGLRYIEDLLWDKGYRNRNDKKIHHNTLSGIITNPKYKGYFCGHKVTIADYRTKEQKFLPQEEWIMYKDETGETVPAIVSEELWEQANAVFIERSNKVKATERSAKKTSPLSGKIICGVHNEPFWRTSYSHRLHPNDSIYEWICRTKKRGKSHDCPTVAIYEKELYNILSDVMLEMVEHTDIYINKFTQIYQSSIGNDTGAKRKKELEKELSALKKKKEKLLDLFTDDIISKAEFKERNSTIDASIASIKTQISTINQNTSFSNSVIKNLTEVCNMVKNFVTNNGELTRQQINDFCELLIESITVTPVEKTTMRLDIKLKMGDCHEKLYKTPYGVRASSVNVYDQNSVRQNAKKRTSSTQHDLHIKQYNMSSQREKLRNQPIVIIIYEINVLL